MTRACISQFSGKVAIVAAATVYGFFSASIPASAQEAEIGPYEPLGLRGGSFVFYPELNLRAGYTDNANGAPGVAQSSTFFSLDGELRAESDWNRHSLVTSLSGETTVFADVSNEDDSEFDADATLTLDVLRNTQLQLDGSYGLESEDNIDDQELGAAAELRHRFNRLTVAVRGSIDDFDFGARGAASLGSSADDAVADYRETGYGMRLTYEVSPDLDIFTDYSLNEREFDQPVDTNGFLRGSNGYEIAAGVNLRLTGKLRGSVSIGYQVQDPDDPAFAEIKETTYDANLVWSVTPLTDIVLAASTDIDETVLNGSGGVVNRVVALGVNHALRRNIELSGEVVYARNDFSDAGPQEEEVSASFEISYLLSRNLALTASYTHFEFSSTVPGADYDSNLYLVGLRLQK